MHSLAPPDKRRPVLVISREEVIQLIDTVMVAPITSTIRGLPSEVQLGTEHGLKHSSVALLDQVRTVRQAELRTYVGLATAETMRLVCRALAIAAGCA